MEGEQEVFPSRVGNRRATGSPFCRLFSSLQQYFTSQLLLLSASLPASDRKGCHCGASVPVALPRWRTECVVTAFLKALVTRTSTSYRPTSPCLSERTGHGHIGLLLPRSFPGGAVHLLWQ